MKYIGGITQKDATVRKNEIARIQALVLDQLDSDEFVLIKQPTYSNSLVGKVSLAGLAKLSTISDIKYVDLNEPNPIKSITESDI